MTKYYDFESRSTAIDFKTANLIGIFTVSHVAARLNVAGISQFLQISNSTDLIQTIIQCEDGVSQLAGGWLIENPS